MNREQMAHVLRAASRIVDDPEVLVIGSQSLLATYDERELPLEATASMEVDLAYLDDPDDRKVDAVDGAIGELSPFHEAFGFYAQGVSVHTAVLSAGWRDRVVHWSTGSTGAARAAFLEPHDCVVSKLVAHRERTGTSPRRSSGPAWSTWTRCAAALTRYPPTWTPGSSG
jgi:hypothetical protein